MSCITCRSISSRPQPNRWWGLPKKCKFKYIARLRTTLPPQPLKLLSMLLFPPDSTIAIAFFMAPPPPLSKNCNMFRTLPPDSSPILCQLHWLPIQQRIHVKILLITYKALHNLAPSYLTDLLQRHSPTRRLRSADHNLLTPISKSKRCTLGDRAFAIAAPTLWNSLPLIIRNSDSLPSFKTQLKTHLFKTAFETC